MIVAAPQTKRQLTTMASLKNRFMAVRSFQLETCPVAIPICRKTDETSSSLPATIPSSAHDGRDDLVSSTFYRESPPPASRLKYAKL